MLPAGAAEGIGNFLRAVGAVSVEVAAGPDGRSTLRAVLEPDRPDFVEDRLAAWLHVFDPRGEATLATARGEAPLEAGWRGVFQGAALGAGFFVRPPWVAAGAGGGRRELVIDPWGAFGTGLHPTTRAVVRACEAHAPPGAGRPALDVGAGSGVLSLVAAGLGWAPVAVELHASARDACRRNAAANGAAVRVVDAQLAAVPERFALVVANLHAGVLAALAADLVRVTAPGGQLVLGGLRPDELDELLGRYPLARGPVVHELALDGSGWAAVVLHA